MGVMYMSERLFTCDICIREGHEEVGCYRPNELIQAGENVVCQGCLECGEFPELEDLPQERFVPPEDKRIQQLEAELEQTKKDLDHMASMHHAQEMKYLKAQSKVNALVEANENLRKLVNALQKEIAS